MSNGAIRLLAVFLGGLLLMLIGFEGNPGSIFGCIIDPAHMTETSPTASGYNPVTGVPAAGILTALQICQLAIGVGFDQVNQVNQSAPPAAIATAIALAASGGKTSDTAGNLVGLWHIAPSAQFSAQQLLNSTNNADAAYLRYSLANFSFYPWQEYSSGKYQQYMGQALTAYHQLKG